MGTPYVPATSQQVTPQPLHLTGEQTEAQRGQESCAVPHGHGAKT